MEHAPLSIDIQQDERRIVVRGVIDGSDETRRAFADLISAAGEMEAGDWAVDASDASVARGGIDQWLQVQAALRVNGTIRYVGSQLSQIVEHVVADEDRFGLVFEESLYAEQN